MKKSEIKKGEEKREDGEIRQGGQVLHLHHHQGHHRQSPGARPCCSAAVLSSVRSHHGDQNSLVSERW